MRRGAVISVGLLFAAVAVWVRLSPAPSTFAEGEVIAAEQDCFYHLHRILETAADFPRTPIRDPWLDWPRGAVVPWPAGFDQLGALLVLATGTGDDPKVAAGAAAMVPVALGLLVVLLTTLIGRRLTPRGAAGGSAIGLAAGLSIALLPQSIAASRIGRIDHHVAEALFAALLFAWTLERASWGAQPAGRRRRLGFEAAGALVGAGAVHTFNGSVLYVAIATGSLIVLHLFERGPEPPRGAADLLRGLVGTGAPGLALAAGIMFVLNAPHVAEHGKVFDHLFTSYLQPALLLFAAIALALASATRRLSSAPLTRAGALALGTVALGAVAALSSPAAREEVAAGLVRWLAKQDSWMARIDETQPLLSGDLWSREAWGTVWSAFGVTGFLSPILLPAGTYVVWREDKRRAFCLAAFTVALLGLTATQARFGRELVVFMALSSGLALELPARALSSRAAISGEVVVLLLAGGLVAADPRLQTYFLPAERLELTALPDAAVFLRDHTPPAKAGERAGVLAPWEMGFAVRQLGAHPVLVSGFGPYLSRETFAEVEAAWGGTEAEMVALLDRRDARYVLAGPSGGPPRRTATGETAFVRDNGRVVMNRGYFDAVPLGHFVTGGSGVPHLELPHLEHFLPIFGSRQVVGGTRMWLPRLWVYERVAGVRVEGRLELEVPGGAPPRVTARMMLRVQGTHIGWYAWTDPAEDGRFSMTLPIWTGMVTGAVVSAPRWELKADAAMKGFEVSERAVREGEVIDLGTIVVPAPAAPVQPSDP